MQQIFKRTSGGIAVVGVVAVLFGLGALAVQKYPLVQGHVGTIIIIGFCLLFFSGVLAALGTTIQSKGIADWEV